MPGGVNSYVLLAAHRSTALLWHCGLADPEVLVVWLADLALQVEQQQRGMHINVSTHS
jgi:hypothetical protein